MDPRHSFEMFKVANTLTQRLLTDAAKFFVSVSNNCHGSSGGGLTGLVCLPNAPSAAVSSPF